MNRKLTFNNWFWQAHELMIELLSHFSVHQLDDSVTVKEGPLCCHRLVGNSDEQQDLCFRVPVQLHALERTSVKLHLLQPTVTLLPSFSFS